MSTIARTGFRYPSHYTLFVPRSTIFTLGGIFLHTESDRTPAVARNARYGLILFIVYVTLYGGFIALAVFRPSVMAAPVWGLNVAIAYGFGLIVSALALAVLYVYLCGRGEDAGEVVE